jgi:hypothetical protein
MQVTLKDYWLDRDRQFPLALSTEIRSNAERMVDLTNAFLREAAAAGVTLERSPRTGSIITSGWRPPMINARIPNAAPRSNHLMARAVDLYDPDGDLDEWALSDAGQAVLTRLGLWLEHPAATKGWCHVQSVPPRSGRRVFYP